MDAYLPGTTTYVCAAIEISAFPAKQARDASVQEPIGEVDD